MAGKYAREVRAVLTQRCFCPPPPETIELCEIVYEAAMTAADASKTPIEHAFRAGHMAGCVHCPIDLTLKEWQLREGVPKIPQAEAIALIKRWRQLARDLNIESKIYPELLIKTDAIIAPSENPKGIGTSPCK